MEAWLVSPGSDSLAKRVVTGIGFCFVVHDLSYDTLCTVSELSVTKIWLAIPGVESGCKVTECGYHVKRVVFWNGFFFVVQVVSCDNLYTVSELSAMKIRSVRPATVPDCKVTDCGSHVKRVNALSLALSEQVWQSGAHVLLCSVCNIPFQLPFMMSLIDSLFTAPVLSTLKSWVVRSAEDCKVTDDGPHVNRVCDQGRVASCPRCVVAVFVEKGLAASSTFVELVGFLSVL